MYAPPVVSEHIEYAQDQDEEGGGPFGFEANSDHNTGSQTKDRNKDATDAPLSLKDESEEKEDQKNTTSQEETTERKMSTITTI